MIKIFYGDDRVRAQQEIKKQLGDSYEILDGPDLTPADLPNIFYGTSLLATTRQVLIRDFTANKEIYNELQNFINTPHNIILFETKLDKRSAIYKELNTKLECKEFKLPDTTDFRQIFDIFKTAKKDGSRAVQMLEQIKINEDPIKFTGLLISQAMKDFSVRPTGTREKRILKELAALDLNMKSTKIDPWLLVESFLLKLSSL